MSGHGGNSAIESAASLAGNLFAAFKKQKATCKVTLDAAQIESLFQITQNERQARTKELIAGSILQQRMAAWDNRVLEIADKFIVPYLPRRVINHLMSSPILGAMSCKALPTSTPPHSIPYNEELQAIGKRRGFVTLYTILGYLALLAGGIYGLAYLPEADGTMDDLASVVNIGHFPGRSDLPLKNFDTVPALGTSMSYLVAVYLPGTEQWNIPFGLLTFYLTISEFVIFATWTVESCRQRSKRSPVGW